MGSNIDPEHHLLTAARAIRKRFPGVKFSGVYRSVAVGMAAADFLNACCLIRTEMERNELNAWLKHLEDIHGRDRARGAWTPRTLDLDILLCGHGVADDNLYRYAHAYVPAAELVKLRPAGDAAAALERIALCL